MLARGASKCALAHELGAPVSAFAVNTVTVGLACAAIPKNKNKEPDASRRQEKVRM